MNVLLRSILIFMTMIPCYSFAHSDHGVIDSETALEITDKSINQMMFKDMGFEVGKLDSTWKGLQRSNFSVVETNSEYFLISVKNPTTNQVIYFKISTNGQVLDVTNTKPFSD